MIIYLASPFRAATPWLVEQNVREVEKVALEVAFAGHVPLAPHVMYRAYDKTLPDEFWLAATLRLLERCDAILMLPRWRESAGARAELKHAQSLKMPVFYDLTALVRNAGEVEAMR
jgi:nucleoside 2-deoxyribosyltransferase